MGIEPSSIHMLASCQMDLENAVRRYFGNDVQHSVSAAPLIGPHVVEIHQNSAIGSFRDGANKASVRHLSVLALQVIHTCLKKYGNADLVLELFYIFGAVGRDWRNL